MPNFHLDRCLEIARTIVWDGVGILLDFYQGRGNLEVQQRDEGPVTAADLTVNHQVISHLQAAFPDPAFG